jgi:hypothetical protein
MSRAILAINRSVPLKDQHIAFLEAAVIAADLKGLVATVDGIPCGRVGLQVMFGLGHSCRSFNLSRR